LFLYISAHKLVVALCYLFKRFLNFAASYPMLNLE
jgi:hypothetical protein